MKESTLRFLFCGVVVASMALQMAGSVAAQMQEPKMVTLSGTVIDLTCAAKGTAMTDSWMNVKQDRMMKDGGTQKACATMCLMGGQAAALSADGQIAAVFACNPRATLAGFAAESVEVQGFWAGEGADVKPFVPTKIRKGSGAWQDVDCMTMHQ